MRPAVVLASFFVFVFVFVFVAACSSSETANEPAKPADAGDAGDDASADAGEDAAPVDASDAGIGQTCVGYGAGDTCATEASKPYGYVCFDGAPPGIAGCKLTRESGSLGNNYCCEENACVEQVDQSAQCAGVAGKPRRLQCPPTDTGNVTPPAGCEEHGSGTTEVEKYYCCP